MMYTIQEAIDSGIVSDKAEIDALIIQFVMDRQNVDPKWNGWDVLGANEEEGRMEVLFFDNKTEKQTYLNV